VNQAEEFEAAQGGRGLSELYEFGGSGLAMAVHGEPVVEGSGLPEEALGQGAGDGGTHGGPVQMWSEDRQGEDGRIGGVTHRWGLNLGWNPASRIGGSMVRGYPGPVRARA